MVSGIERMISVRGRRVWYGGGMYKASYTSDLYPDNGWTTTMEQTWRWSRWSLSGGANQRHSSPYEASPPDRLMSRSHTVASCRFLRRGRGGNANAARAHIFQPQQLWGIFAQRICVRARGRLWTARRVPPRPSPRRCRGPPVCRPLPGGQRLSALINPTDKEAAPI